MTPLRNTVQAAALAVLVAACGAAPEGGMRELPLVDGAHAPDILTESAEIELPPSTEGNRFLTGWWPWTSRQRTGLVPYRGRARLEGTNVAGRARELVLDCFTSFDDAMTVSVRFGGRTTGESYDLLERTVIPMPADLPLGRFPIDLEFSHGDRVAVQRAGLRRPAKAGEVTVEGADLLQSGWSIADLARPVEAGSVLVGRFEPPAEPQPEQSFRLLVEREDGSQEEVFAWRPRRFWPSGERSIEVPLGASEGWLRVRMVAAGTGPPARWRGLALRVPGDSPPPTSIAAPELPRLVVVYILDALRRDYLGHLGGPEGISPTLDRLAAEGVTFTNHLSVAPNTVPSMKTLFTGQVFLLQGGSRLPADGPRTWAQRFTAAGFRTGLFTGNGNVSAWRGLTRGFEFSPRNLHFDRVSRWSQSHYNDNAELVHAATLEWLDSLEPGSRAFAHLQTIHPHNPYDPPKPLAEEWTAGIDSEIDGSTRTLLDIKRRLREIEPPDEERLERLYAGSVAYNDAEIERFLAALFERVPPEEVLLIVTSDHGEELFERGGVLHGYTLYEEQLQIPLIFWWPGRIAPAVIDTATDTTDLHRTLALAVDGAEAGELGGENLWPIVLGDASEAPAGKEVRFAAASSLDGGIFMASSHRYKLIWAPRTGRQWGQGQGRGRDHEAEVVFDLENDPGETNNLAGEDLLEVAWLRSRLAAWIELGLRLETGEPLEEMDEETRRSLRALGYIQ